MKDKHLRLQRLNSLMSWIEGNGLKGYDPYDIKCHSNLTRSIYHDHLGLGIVGKILSYGLFEILDIRFPGLLRKLFFVSKKEYATSSSHIAQAMMYRNQEKTSVDAILNGLWQHRLQKNGQPGWGLAFTWGTKDRRFTPQVSLTVVNVWVGEAFLLAYDKWGEKDYLDKAISIADGIISVCGYSKFEDGKICFHYSDKTQDQIHNANLLAASFLTKCYERGQQKNFKDLAIKAVEFSLSRAYSDGTLPYKSGKDVLHSKNDLYHCGYEIRSIYHVGKTLGISNFTDFASNYWQKIRERFLDFEKPFYYRAEKSRPIADTTSLAELILLETELELNNKDLSKLIEHFVVKHQNPDGSYIYQERKNGLLSRIPYIRWSQGWMALALAKNLYHENISCRQ